MQLFGIMFKDEEKGLNIDIELLQIVDAAI